MHACILVIMTHGMKKMQVKKQWFEIKVKLLKIKHKIKRTQWKTKNKKTFKANDFLRKLKTYTQETPFQMQQCVKNDCACITEEEDKTYNKLKKIQKLVLCTQIICVKMCKMSDGYGEVWRPTQSHRQNPDTVHEKKVQSQMRDRLVSECCH